MDKRLIPLHLDYDQLSMESSDLLRSLANRLMYTIGKDHIIAKNRDWYFALAYVVRERLMERWMRTMRSYYRKDVKRVYYLSLEFLIGRSLSNSLLNIGFPEECAAALAAVGLKLEDLSECEPDAALGNGGLGRLAACFLDSLASLALPGFGYGIRYEYGMFRQGISDGCQVEHPDNWLRYGNPWEFPRSEKLYPVRFGGRVVTYKDDDGKSRHHWVDTDDVMAMAYDTPVPGYRNNTVNNLRLWSAKATRDFDLRYFNEGNYIKAVEDKNQSENLSKVLYPDDTTRMGRALRLKQEYFFVSASLQDILHRYRRFHDTFDELPDKVAIQLNDTHPAVGIAELMRLLIDVHHLGWDQAWHITKRTFSYTNHTLMPEALETWPVEMFDAVLPRHIQLIYEINHRFLRDVGHRFPGDQERARRMSLIAEDGPRAVRMAHLAIVGSHKVNGVSRIHTELMKDTIFSDFDQMEPGKIINKTNGITPRRWLNQANPGLAALITARIGGAWVADLMQLKRLEQFAAEPAFQTAVRAVKQANKQGLAAQIHRQLGIAVNCDSLFDVQVKRLHEYKRQLLNVLHIITLYNELRADPNAPRVPRTVIIAGKAAPGYATAKLIIKLINDVADVVNNDVSIGDRLKVAFLPNYDVSLAQVIIPAADLSEQISTAGTEASGTGNMKLSLNGALTIGTRDGANIEIGEAVGEDNIFFFGLGAAEVAEIRARGYNPWDHYYGNAELKQALDMLGSGYFSAEAAQRFLPLVEQLTLGGDHYLLLADYASYVACQRRIDEVYRAPQDWTRRAIINVANMGRFSSDRTIAEYAAEIWGVKPVPNE